MEGLEVGWLPDVYATNSSAERLSLSPKAAIARVTYRVLTVVKLSTVTLGQTSATFLAKTFIIARVMYAEIERARGTDCFCVVAWFEIVEGTSHISWFPYR
jgi:hypothetical protein